LTDLSISIVNTNIRELLLAHLESMQQSLTGRVEGELADEWNGRVGTAARR
jgi:hypothetical protein